MCCEFLEGKHHIFVFAIAASPKPFPQMLSSCPRHLTKAIPRGKYLEVLPTTGILFLRFIFCVCVHVRAWPETSDVLELELQRLKATQLLSTLLQPSCDRSCGWYCLTLDDVLWEERGTKSPWTCPGHHCNASSTSLLFPTKQTAIQTWAMSAPIGATYTHKLKLNWDVTPP